MLTTSELQVVSGLMDAGIRSMGLSICQNGGAATLQSAFDKLEAMAAEAAKPTDASAADPLPDPQPEA